MHENMRLRLHARLNDQDERDFGEDKFCAVQSVACGMA